MSQQIINMARQIEIQKYGNPMVLESLALINYLVHIKSLVPQQKLGKPFGRQRRQRRQRHNPRATCMKGESMRSNP